MDFKYDDGHNRFNISQLISNTHFPTDNFKMINLFQCNFNTVKCDLNTKM